MDIAGIDVLAHVARTWRALPTRGASVRAAAARRRAGRARLGRREGGPGLLQAREDAPAAREILDARSGDADVPAEAAGAPAVARGRAQRSRTSASASRRCSSGSDKVGEFLRDTLGPTLVYAARVAPDIAYSIDDVDRAMRWGFGWELGPFEIVGRDRRPRGARRAAVPTCRRSSPMLEPAATASATAALPPAGAGPADPARPRRSGSASSGSNAGASLVDLGDGVLARRVPLEDERDRRRHDPDAARRRQGGRGELRGARRRQRRAELLRRREPDAAAARSAGRQLGRDRPDGPRVPGRDAGAALRGRAGRRRARRA